VIVRNTFIEIERPADTASVRRSSSLPHAWRFRDHVDSLISACTRLAIPDAVDQTRALQIEQQSGVDSSISTVPTVLHASAALKAEKLLAPQKPVSLQIPAEKIMFHVDRNACAMRLNALDLFVPQQNKPRHVGASVTQVAPRRPQIGTTLSSSRCRSSSASSDKSRCSGNSLGTKTTGCGSGSDMGSATSDAGSFPAGAESPSNAKIDRVTPPSPDNAIAVAHVSGSRRSRRRRAAARKAAEQAQLRIHAPAFQPNVLCNQQRCPLTNEMMDMISVAQASVLSCPHVLSVQIVKPVVHETRMTSIVVSYHPGKVWEHDVRTLAKNAFLEAAEKSQQVFILGHGVEPFVDECQFGFTATIGSVPVDCQHAICWDFWQKGFCQRLSTCRWCHPVSSDLMDVKFVFEPAQALVQQQPQQQQHQQLPCFWNGAGFHVDSQGPLVATWMGCSS